MTTESPQGEQPISERLVELFARALWADDEEQRRRSAVAQVAVRRTYDATPWERATQWDHAEYRDRARRVLDRVLP